LLKGISLRECLTVAVIAAVTVALELAVFYCGRHVGLPGRDAAIASIAAATVWVALAAPVLAAGRDTPFAAVIRGGAIADASAVLLVVLWLSETGVTFVSAAEVYCVWAAMALAAMALVRMARTSPGRYAVAVGVAALEMLALSTPLWVNGLLAALEGSWREGATAWAVRINPFYSILAALAERMHFVWNEAPLMYRLTRIGDYAAPPAVAWYTAVVIYLIVAALACGVSLLRPRRQS